MASRGEPQRVAEFQWSPESGVTVNTFDQEWGAVALYHYNRGVSLVSEKRDVLPSEGPEFMRALLKRNQMSYYGFVDESEGLVGRPPGWSEHGARLAELVDDATFTAIEQAVARWGSYGKATRGRALVTELGIIAVEVLVRAGVMDPDVLAATAVCRAVDPRYGGKRSKVTKLPDGRDRVAKLLKAATSPTPPPSLEAGRGKYVFAVFVNHLRAMPWQVRAIVLATRIADISAPSAPDRWRDRGWSELAEPLLSCAKDLPERLQAQVAELTGADPTGPERVDMTPMLRPSITSPAQAIDRVRAVIDEHPEQVAVDDVGLAYAVRAGNQPDDVYFVHKLWGTVDSGFTFAEYRAEYDVFPLEPVGQAGDVLASTAENPPDAHERFIGSMLGGAVGDALGYTVEFHDIGTIRRDHGDAGLTAPVLRGGVAQISDDTQMMLFTLEGLVRAHVARRLNPTDNDPVPEVQHAYQRWFHTQDQPWHEVGGPYARHLQQPDGWLITNRGLFAQRGPGRTCLSALRQFAQTHRQATPQFRVNDSKGCGGVMRAAPVAVWSNDPAEVFFAAVGTAALTHGHPSGFLSAGVLSVIVHQLIRDVSLPDSVRLARDLLLRWREHEEQLRALDAAVELAKKGPVNPEELENTLGKGAVGEEALAIGLYSVLATDNLRDALLLSVNHSGDSDSTGIVAGNIGGALYGTRAIPQEWLATLELRDVVETLAKDALVEFSPGPPADQAWMQRYPAW